MKPRRRGSLWCLMNGRMNGIGRRRRIVALLLLSLRLGVGEMMIEMLRLLGHVSQEIGIVRDHHGLAKAGRDLLLIGEQVALRDLPVPLASIVMCLVQVDEKARPIDAVTARGAGTGTADVRGTMIRRPGKDLAQGIGAVGEIGVEIGIVTETGTDVTSELILI